MIRSSVLVARLFKRVLPDFTSPVFLISSQSLKLLAVAVINAELKELLSEHDAQAVQREHLDEKLVGVLTHLNEDYEVANYLLQRKALTEEGAALQGGVPARQEKKRKSWFR